MKIGCVVLAYANTYVGPQKFHALKCAKKRGIILPGGKYDPDIDESYHHAAAREFEEEIGIKLDVADLKYLWHGPDNDNGNITFGFICYSAYGQTKSSKEGEPVLATWEDLFQSKYYAWYRVLKDVLDYKELITRKVSTGTN